MVLLKRRNTCTAVLFLIGIFSALIFLCFGAFSDTGSFAVPVRPAHATGKTKAMFLLSPTGSGKTAGARFRHNKWEDIVAKAQVLEAQKLPHAARRARHNATKQRPAVQRPLPPAILTSLGLRVAGYDEVMDALTDGIAGTETGIHQLLDRDHAFIELYGAAQQLLGRRVIEDADPQYTVVRLSNGQLSFTALDRQPEDMSDRAGEMADFARRLQKEYKTPLLYVQAPSKLDVAQLPDGVTGFADDEADQFIALLDAEGVDVLDLRPTFRAAAREDPDAAADLFFNTDHHWTPAGAFVGYQKLCDKLVRRYRFSIDQELTDQQSFDRFNFRASFLGSQGRRVGSAYAGLDDLEIWSPKFSTNFTYSVPISGITREGPFAVSLLFPERLAQEGLYTTNPYTIYSGDDYLLARAINHKNPDGKRIMVLRDSFGCAITPFLALACQEVIAIDPRNFNGNQDTMIHYVSWLDPDVVIVLNTTGSLEVDTLFPYLPTARAAALETRE